MDSRIPVALALTVLFVIVAAVVFYPRRCCTSCADIEGALVPHSGKNATVVEVNLVRPARVNNLEMVHITLRIGDYSLPLAYDNRTWLGSLNGCDYMVLWMDKDSSGDLNSGDALKIITTEPTEANLWLYLAVEGYHGELSCKIPS